MFLHVVELNTKALIIQKFSKVFISANFQFVNLSIRTVQKVLGLFSINCYKFTTRLRPLVIFKISCHLLNGSLVFGQICICIDAN